MNEKYTVKELIKKLKEFDEDATIELYATFDCGYGWAGGRILSFETATESTDGHGNKIKGKFVRIINEEC